MRLAAAASVSRGGGEKPAGSQPVPTTALRTGCAMTPCDSALVMRATQVRGAFRTLDPYSGKFSLGTNFRDFRGRACFRENKNCKKKKMEIDDVILFNKPVSRPRRQS